MHDTVDNLEAQLKEERAKVSEALKHKQDTELTIMTISKQQAKIEELERDIKKSQAECKVAENSVEKAVAEKKDLESKVKVASSKLHTTTQSLKQKEEIIKQFDIKLGENSKMLESLNSMKQDEKSASLNALKTLFAEKDAECTKMNAELELERKRNAEFKVTIKVFNLYT